MIRCTPRLMRKLETRLLDHRVSHEWLVDHWSRLPGITSCLVSVGRCHFNPKRTLRHQALRMVAKDASMDWPLWMNQYLAEYSKDFGTPIGTCICLIVIAGAEWTHQAHNRQRHTVFSDRNCWHKCQVSYFVCTLVSNTRMWANVQPDGRPAEHRWRPLFNAAKFGWRPLLDAVQ